MIMFLFLSYLNLSYVDWALHKYILHDKESQSGWRIEHQEHHADSEATDKLCFYHKEISVITASSLPIFVMICRLFDYALPICVFAHFCAIIIIVMMYNYSHSITHGGTPPSFSIYTPWATLLKENHLLHHKYHNCNFCTVVPGFDHLVGTRC